MTICFKSEIIKQLERADTYGSYDYSRTFDDFLTLANACLDELPRHFASAIKTHQLAEDTQPTKDLFEQLNKRYRPQAFDYFARALACLIESAEEWGDTIGDVYMEFGHPSKQGGQYFTPYAIAKMMGMTTAGTFGEGGSIERQVHDRIKAACQKNPIAAALLLASFAIQDPEQAWKYFLNTIIPAALPDIEPIKVMDPACGSGVMFLGFAEQCPRWALDYGLIQFWGMDIDQTCVDMAKLNMKLYGLNGYGIKHVLALQAYELAAVPEPYKSSYQEVIAHPEKIEQISQELWSYKQTALF